MIIAADVGTTFQLGPYTVRISLRKDNPAWARYLVFRGVLLVGQNFSRPSLADCQWLERWGNTYAEPSDWEYTSSLCQQKRGGRARQTERKLQEAIAA